MQEAETFHAHIIFSTKGWQPLITQSLLSDIVERLTRNFKLRNSKLLLANGNDNHIHILGKFNDYQSFSRIVGWSKGECSNWINRKYPTLGFYWQKGFWHERIPEEQIPEVRTYIEDQLTIHEQLTFMEEIRKFRKARID